MSDLRDAKEGMASEAPSVHRLYVAASRGADDEAPRRGSTLQLCYLRSPPCRLGRSAAAATQPRLLVPAPRLDAAAVHAIDLIAPPLVCTGGRRPWTPGLPTKRRRQGEGDEQLDRGGLQSANDRDGVSAARCTSDAWEALMLQMLARQALADSERCTGLPILPLALANQLCRMPFSTLVDFFGSETPAPVPALPAKASGIEHAEIAQCDPSSPAWTLAHLEAVCRACVQANNLENEGAGGGSGRSAAAGRGGVSRDLADAILMHALYRALKPDVQAGGMLSFMAQVERLVEMVFADSSLSACEPEELVETLVNLGWEDLGEVGAAASRKAVMCHFAIRRFGE